MKAVILVGGKATRLRPLTMNIPKAMVPVLNRPFMEYTINHLVRHDFADVIMALGHLSQPIVDYFADGKNFYSRIVYSLEESPRDTAGAVKQAETHLDDTFLVLNGDIFTDLDISAMLRFHREHKAKVTIALTPVADPTAYGLIETESDGRVKRFLEKPSIEEVTTNMINAGTYIIEPEVLRMVPPQGKFSFERALFPELVRSGDAIYGYPSDAYWIDIGTPAKYLELNWHLLSKIDNIPAKDYRLDKKINVDDSAFISGHVAIGKNTTIGKNVRITGPAVIGENCFISGYTDIEKSVIWKNTQVAPGVIINNSVVAGGCRLGKDCRIDTAVIGDNIIVEASAKVTAGTRIPALGEQ